MELCDNLLEGGTTPGAGTIALARAHLSIKLYVMIRPRGGDFCYSPLEFDIMKEDVKTAVSLGADGIVAGILMPDGTIDRERMSILRDLAGDCGFTCHRAFDMTADKHRALDDLISLGIERVLTSGGRNKAPEGRELIREMVRKAGDDIIIMPGSGVNEDTVQELRKYTGASEFHVTGRSVLPGRMEYRNPDVSMGGDASVPEYEQWVTDPGRIRKILEIANT